MVAKHFFLLDHPLRLANHDKKGSYYFNRPEGEGILKGWWFPSTYK